MKLSSATTLVLVAISYVGCQPKSNTTVAETFRLPRTIIQQCIDSTLVLDSKINTETFYVDVESLKQIDPESVATYLNEHDELRVTNLDSLIKVKSAWLKNEFFMNDIIRFEKVENVGSDTVIVRTTKRRAIDASFGTEIVFKKVGDSVLCITSEITWIN